MPDIPVYLQDFTQVSAWYLSKVDLRTKVLNKLTAQNPGADLW